MTTTNPIAVAQTFERFVAYHWYDRALAMAEDGSLLAARFGEDRYPMDIAIRSGDEVFCRALFELGYRHIGRVHEFLCQASFSAFFTRTYLDMGYRPQKGEPIVIHCVTHGIPDALCLLVQAGADVNEVEVRNAYTTPAMVKAALLGRADMVQCLAELGADVFAASARGMTALHAAAGQWSTHATQDPHALRQIATVLIAAGLPVDTADARGNTPLHVAASHGEPVQVGILLQCGADTGLANADGLTPLDLAEKRGRSDVVKAFEDGRQPLLFSAIPDSRDNTASPLPQPAVACPSGQETASAMARLVYLQQRHRNDWAGAPLRAAYLLLKRLEVQRKHRQN